MLNYRVLIFLSLVLFVATNKHVSKRSLLFPRATVLQFTYGVSAPALLPSRSINLSLAVQVNYDLPYNITQLTQTRIVQAKANAGFDLSRETSYKYMVQFLETFGLNGEECLFRLICEISEHPMHLDHKENLLEKIVHFVFTPSLEMSNNSIQLFVRKLLEAEHFGKSDGQCDQKYSECFVSLVSLFTTKYII